MTRRPVVVVIIGLAVGVFVRILANLPAQGSQLPLPFWLDTVRVLFSYGYPLSEAAFAGAIFYFVLPCLFLGAYKLTVGDYSLSSGLVPGAAWIGLNVLAVLLNPAVGMPLRWSTPIMDQLDSIGLDVVLTLLRDVPLILLLANLVASMAVRSLQRTADRKAEEMGMVRRCWFTWRAIAVFGVLVVLTLAVIAYVLVLRIDKQGMTAGPATLEILGGLKLVIPEGYEAYSVSASDVAPIDHETRPWIRSESLFRADDSLDPVLDVEVYRSDVATAVLEGLRSGLVPGRLPQKFGGSWTWHTLSDPADDPGRNAIAIASRRFDEGVVVVTIYRIAIKGDMDSPESVFLRHFTY